MLLRRTERLPLILPSLESALKITETLAVPVLAACLEYSIATAYGTKKMPRATLLQTVIWVIFFGLNILLLQVPRIRRTVQDWFASIRRSAVLSCPSLSIQRFGGWRPACWIVPEPYKQPLFSYHSQNLIVRSIIRRLCDEEERTVRFVYIEGVSGSGKTQTVFLLTKSLLKTKDLSELASRAFLYDLGAGRASQDALLQRLDSPEHEQALVFIDNFHRVEPRLLKILTSKLLDANQNQERLIVLLGQPSEAWVLHPTTDVTLMSQARATSNYFSLEGVSSDLVLKELDDPDAVRIWESIFGAGARESATVPQIKLAQAVIRDRRDLKFVEDLFRLVEKDPQRTRQSEKAISCCIAILTGLTLYSGYTTKSDFVGACWRVSRIQRWDARIIYCLRMWRLLNRISRTGFVTEKSIIMGRVDFHEATSEHCKQRMQNTEAFSKCFRIAAEWRLARKRREDPTLDWLISCDLHDVGSMERTFERALLRGNLSRMAKSLDQNWQELRHSPVVGYQYALLLDKSGRFSESRQVFKELTSEGSSAPVAADRVRLSWVEASHDENSNAIVEQIAKSTDDGNRIAAVYWEVHLQAHRGHFNPDRLTALARELGEVFKPEEIDNSYFLLHIAARIFFDAHRHVYLVGDQVEERLSELDKLPIRDKLKKQLPQYLGFSVLYREAHRLAHEVLPKLVFFETPARTDFLTANPPEEFDRSKLLCLVQLAASTYIRARDEFKTYGDREALYLQADILNIAMLEPEANPVQVKSRLVEYETFITKAGFVDIMSYPCFYFFRWHMILYFRSLLSGDHECDAAKEASKNINLAKEYLQRAVEFDRKADNAYGLWRIELFQGIIENLMSANDRRMRASLLRCREEAEKHGYRRDAELVLQLCRSELTSGDLKRFVSYYPFVHQ